MEDNILIDFETFYEFPDKYLCINNKSNYYYIKKDDNVSIAIRSIESISTDGKETTIIIDYYSVLDGKLVLRTKSIDSQSGIVKEMNGAEVISLSEILNIKNDDSYYLSIEDINTLIGFKEENAKTYGMTPRNNYF